MSDHILKIRPPAVLQQWIVTGDILVETVKVILHSQEVGVPFVRDVHFSGNVELQDRITKRFYPPIAPKTPRRGIKPFRCGRQLGVSRPVLRVIDRFGLSFFAWLVTRIVSPVGHAPHDDRRCPIRIDRWNVTPNRVRRCLTYSLIRANSTVELLGEVVPPGCQCVRDLVRVFAAGFGQVGAAAAAAGDLSSPLPGRSRPLSGPA
jgi:hypothetical protein